MEKNEETEEKRDGGSERHGVMRGQSHVTEVEEVACVS